MICYWDLIFRTFLTLVGGRNDLLPLIDGVTVGLIQARAPKLSANDLQFLQLQMDGGKLFAEFEEEQRKDIWERLKAIDYPIPTLKTFFKDRLYLEVAQSVMKRLFIQPRDEKVTIDTGVYGIFDTVMPIPMSQRKEHLRSDVLEFWRFSFQYGFELTDHQRRKCLKSRESGHTPDQEADRSFPLHRSDMWRHFGGTLTARGFRPPDSMTQSSPMIELPPLVPCDYPEDPSQEIDAAKRCGKPFVDTREADWYALSAESLQQHWTATRVSAVFLRRWVFQAFFGYLMDSEGSSQTFFHRHSEESGAVRGDRAETAPGDSDPTAPTAPDIAAEAPSNLPTFSSAPMIDSFAPLVPTFAGSFVPSAYTMHVKIGEIRETLHLPLDESFMNKFCEGLTQHKFAVSVFEPAPGTSSEFLVGAVPYTPRHIYPENSYTHYLAYPASELHAEFNTETAYIDAGRKRQRIDVTAEMEEEMMERAKTWLEEEKAKIHSRNRPQTIDLDF